VLLAGLFGLGGCWQEKRDPWEATQAPQHNPDSCKKLDDALVAPVPEAARAEAISRLESVSAIALDEPEAARLLGVPASEASAAWRLSAAISELEDEKRQGSWGPLDQERLDALQALSGGAAPPALKPYLVRAVAKNEQTGHFRATRCGDDLVVSHGSLGHSTPRSTRLPLVVFLERAPVNIYVRWSMAE
jgi:hypothetical protein